MADSPAQTLTFSEGSNSFESFLSYHPEMMCTLGNLLITYQDGQLYTHDGTVYNNFYGVQYDSSARFVFNDFGMQKKTFKAVEEIASVIWKCPEIETSLMSYGTTPQQSALDVSDFEELEGTFCASLFGDSNSDGGLINGDSLKGLYMSINFQAVSPTELTNLALVSVRTLDSALNIK